MFFYLINDSPSLYPLLSLLPLLANSTTFEISRTMAWVKAWITVVSYLSPHLQPVVSLSEDVVKPSQTLKHPVASPCLYCPQSPTPKHTHTHLSFIAVHTWMGTDHCGQFTDPRDAVCWSEERLDLFWKTWNAEDSFRLQVKPSLNIDYIKVRGKFSFKHLYLHTCRITG